MAPRRISVFLAVTVLGSALGSSMLGSSIASAADLDGSYGDPQQMPEQKVEFGTGWYIRGDMGAIQDYALAMQRVSAQTEGVGLSRTHTEGYNLSLGAGYKFTNAIRGDITADFHQPVSTTAGGQLCYSTVAPATGPLGNCESYGRFNSYDALVNGYYDFGTWSRVTPYVGAGVGIGFGDVNTTLYGDPVGLVQYKTAYHTLAYALMAGVAIDVFDHTKLDIGYRYLGNSSIVGTNVYFHEIRAGLRYMIDN